MVLEENFQAPFGVIILLKNMENTVKIARNAILSKPRQRLITNALRASQPLFFRSPTHPCVFL